MKCHRCGGTMVYERFYGPGENFSGWRCVSSGEILDEKLFKLFSAINNRLLFEVILPYSKKPE